MIYRFGQLFNVVDGDRGKNYPKDCDFSDKGYCLFLNAGNVTKNGWAFENNSFITEEKDQLLHNGRLTRENTVFTTRGTVGNAAYYGKNIPFEHIRINSGMVILSSKDTSLIQNKFIYYLVTSPYAKKTIEMFCSGSAQPQLPIKDFVKIKFNLPSIEHQQKITYILSAYDDLIENNNKRIKILEQMAENLYKEWFVRFRFPDYQNTEFENGFPKGWKVIQVQDLFDISIGRTPDRKVFEYYSNNQSDYLWISIADMKDKIFVMSSSEYLTCDAIRKVNMPMVSENTVILSFKLSVGRVAITTQLSCTNEAIAHFNTNNKQLLEYTYLYLKFFQYQDLGNTSAIGNAVNSTIIRKMKFLYPDEKILEFFHLQVKSVFDEIKLLSCKNQNLTKQRDMLLPRLMSGKLEV